MGEKYERYCKDNLQNACGKIRRGYQSDRGARRKRHHRLLRGVLGAQRPQVKALCEHLEETMEKQNRFALHKDGLREGKWVAVDYGDVIVHVFHKDVRSVYALDVLWDHGGNVTRYE